VDVIAFDSTNGLPPDIEAPTPRSVVDGDPDGYFSTVLVQEFFTRLNEGIAALDVEQVLATVMPQVLAGPNAAQCRAEVEASLLLADSVNLEAIPSGPDTSRGFPVYAPQASISYPTGVVAWTPFLVPGPGGRLHQVFGSCI
jgi:hypothetical protein